MAKLVFHEEANRQLEGGVSDVVLFPMTSGSYDIGVAWDGVTAINENPSGADITDLYADDEKYASLQAAEKFGFGIEAFRSPPEFDACDGSETVNGVSFGQQSRKPFGIAYKTKIGDANHPGLDAGYKLHIIYNSLAQPSGRNYATINENPDAMSMSWDANSTPTKVTTLKPDGTPFKSVSKITLNSIEMKKKSKGDKLEEIEAMIYGDTNSDPTLPNPDQILAKIQ